MSSRLKRLRGTRPPLPHCATCGKSVPKAMARKVIPNGQGIVCGRCLALGVTCRRLGCGHYGVIGVKTTAASDPSLSYCVACSEQGSLTDKVLGYVGARPAGPSPGLGAR